MLKSVEYIVRDLVFLTNQKLTSSVVGHLKKYHKLLARTCQIGWSKFYISIATKELQGASSAQHNLILSL
jgi:hypothetical protein